jgi:hypothetical protein
VDDEAAVDVPGGPQDGDGRTGVVDRHEDLVEIVAASAAVHQLGREVHGRDSLAMKSKDADAWFAWFAWF